MTDGERLRIADESKDPGRMAVAIGALVSVMGEHAAVYYVLLGLGGAFAGMIAAAWTWEDEFPSVARLHFSSIVAFLPVVLVAAVEFAALARKPSAWIAVIFTLMQFVFGVASMSATNF